jgi:hypothetical protein
MAPESPAAGDWTAAMQKAQSELLRQWTDMGLAWSRAAAATPAPMAPMDTAPPPPVPPPAPSPAAAPPGGEDITRNFLQQCEQYLGVSRSLWDLLGRASTASDPEQRTRLFTDGLGSLQQQFAGLWAATPFGAGAAGPAMFGGGLFGGGLPGMGSAFAVPALGPARESQESWQRLGQLGNRYLQAQVQVGSQWNDIIGRSLRELGERLAPRLKSGTPPGSMKEVYDLWIDSAENVYAQAARGAAFVQAQAELTNSMSQLRSAQRELLEEMARQFDLPTRAELNSVHQQLRELKAALQRLRG